jgi:hypothetical protein
MGRDNDHATHCREIIVKHGTIAYVPRETIKARDQHDVDHPCTRSVSHDLYG